jgi:enhancing lycopene biosynthesis protein 2
MKKIAVILSGCGNKDGSEITEAASLLIALSQNGAQTTCFAPDLQFSPLNFLTGETLGEIRNVLTESARICRGQIQNLALLHPADFDGLAFVGGQGVVRYLSDWAANKSKCTVLKDVVRVIQEFHQHSKPIGAICISPVLVAKVLGPHKVEITVGNDPETIAEVVKTGAHHEVCPADDFVTDRLCKVITTPAYMCKNAKPHEIFKGIVGMTKELVEMA